MLFWLMKPAGEGRAAMLDVSFRAEGRQVALVTGASGGIGAATVEAFVSAGVTVVAADIRPRPDPEGAAPGLVDSIVTDVASEVDIDALARHVGEAHGRLDHLVHAAGIIGSGPLAVSTLADWHRVMDVNLTATFLLARAFHPLLAASEGSMVVLGSSNGVNGGSAISGPAYAAAKAGMQNLVRNLAKEWAPDKVRINMVAPGPVDTPMIRQHGDEVRETLRSAVLLGRVGRAAEIAANILFLCSRQAAWQTGSVVNVSGGLVL